MDVFLDSFFNDFFGSDARCPKNKFGLKEIAFNDCPEAPRIKVPTSSDRAGTDLTRVNVGGRLYCFEKLDPEDYSYGTRWRIYRFRPGHARQFPPIFGMVQFSSGQVKPLFVLDRIKADEAGLEGSAARFRAGARGELLKRARGRMPLLLSQEPVRSVFHHPCVSRGCARGRAAGD